MYFIGMTIIAELTKHKVNQANDQLRIFVLDDKGSGGANHVYAILTPLKDPIKEEACTSSQEFNLANDFTMKLWPFQGFAKIFCFKDTNPPTEASTYYTVNLVSFQNGPINEVGVNGQTHEAYLAILIHRLEGFQSGKYSCHDNQVALDHLEAARMWLQKRTIDRMNRGVEGTHKI